MNKEDYKNSAFDYLQKTYPQINPRPKLNEFSIDTDKGNISLEVPYNESSVNNYALWEKDLENYILKILRILETSQQSTQDKWENVSSKILPQIKTMGQLSAINNNPDFPNEKDHVVYKMFIEDLCVTWVIDMPEGFRYITGKDLEKWNKKIEDLEILATENLKKLPATAEGPKQAANGDGSFSYVWNSGDGYDASRILLPEFHDFIKQTFGGKYIIAVPHRDMLFASQEKYSDRLSYFAQEKFKSNPHPITELVLVWN